MRGPMSVLAGFVLGVVVAGLVLGGILALTPEPVRSTPPPISAAPTPTPTAQPSPSPSTGSATPSIVPSPSGSPARLHIGEPAPALSVAQVGGGTIDIASLKGQPVWVTFMTSACPSCQDQFRLMNGFATRYAPNGLEVIAVDVGEDAGAAAELAQNLGATFPVGLDEDGSAAQAWDAVTLPVHFWLDKDGVIRDEAAGEVAVGDMVQALEAIMPGVTVTP